MGGEVSIPGEISFKRKYICRNGIELNKKDEENG